jgi:PII-like signaling protein
VLTSGPAKKVAIYVAEDQQYHGSAAYAAILDFLFFRGVAGATVTRGIAGFGSDHQLHTTRLVDLATHLPIKVEFIETSQKVEELLPKLQAMVGTGLIEMHDTTIVKPAETKKEKAAVPEKPALKSESKAKLMRIYVGENDKLMILPASRFTAAFWGTARIGESTRMPHLAYRMTGRSCSPLWTRRRSSRDSCPFWTKWCCRVWLCFRTWM